MGEPFSKRQLFNDALDKMPQEFKLDDLCGLLELLNFSIYEVVGHLSVRCRRGELKRLKVGLYAKTQA